MAAFDGVRVLDFSRRTAGPYAGMLLAEQGADVVKVEPPGGDPSRGTPAFHVLNRGKRSIVLDLRRDGDRREARRLARQADVVIVDLLPHEALALNFDYQSLREENPGLVYCAVPLYGSRGPWARIPPDDTLAAAVTGVLGVQWAYTERPVYMVVPLVAYATGVLAAGAIAATLFDRCRGKGGDYIEVSGLGGAFALQSSTYIFPLGALEVIRLAGRGDPKGALPAYRLFQASDGEWFFLGSLTPVFWVKLALTLGLEDLLADPRFEGAPLAIPVPEDRQELIDRLTAIFSTHPRQHWLDLLTAADIPAGPVFSREDFAVDSVAVENEMLIDLDDPEVGRTRQPSVLVHLKGSAVKAPAPLLGRHNDEVLAEPADQAFVPQGASANASAPLAGITVLDLGTVYAGPFTGMLLSDLGAEVIKVEPLDGDPWRGFALGFLGANRGKLGLALDMKKEEGLRLFYDLVRKADVVSDNFRVGVLERLKIDYETLSRLNPGIICCSIAPFGRKGPMASRPGFDPLFQARSGLMRAQGGDDGEPVYYQIAVSDFMGALLQAYGVIAALHERERTGKGQLIQSSLAMGAMAAQIAEFVQYEGRPPDVQGGRDLLGRSGLYRCYRCADGWVFLAVSDREQAAALVRLVGEELSVRAGHDIDLLLKAPLEGETATILERYFAEQSSHSIVARLTSRGVPCAPCLDISTLVDDEHLKENEMWWDAEHPVNGPIRQTGRIVKWAERSMRLERPAPTLGQHSREVLLKFGVAPDRIEALIAEGVVFAG